MLSSMVTQQSKIYEDIVDHGSYVHDLSSCEIKALKNIQA